jgi:hypothetical protein
MLHHALAFGLQAGGYTPTELSTEAAVTLEPEFFNRIGHKWKSAAVITAMSALASIATK